MTQISDNPFEGADAPAATQQMQSKPNPFISTPPQPRPAEPPRIDNPFQSSEPVQTFQPITQQVDNNIPSVQMEPPVDIPTMQPPVPDLSQGVTMSNQSMYQGGIGFPPPQGLTPPMPNFNDAQPPSQFQVPQPQMQMQPQMPPMQMQTQMPPMQMQPQMQMPPQMPPQQGWPQQGGMQPAGNQFAPQHHAAPQQNWNNNNGGQQVQKYNIIDMYWLTNKKYSMQIPFEQGEVGLITIGFNANFNNMRFSLHNIDPNMINQPALVIANCPRAAIINIYSESAGEVLFSKGSGRNVMTQERMFKEGSWNPSQSAWNWGPDKVTLYAQDQNGASFCYTFVDYQIKLLENCLNWMISGPSWSASLSMMK